MTKNKLNTGDILRIPLWNKLGFAYAKYMDLSQSPSVNMPSLIKVYCYWTKTMDFDLEMIKESKYLIQPILVAGINPAIRKGLWEIVGNVGKSEEDMVLPHFRSHEPRWEEENNAKEWSYIKDCDVNKRIKTSLEKIKHLERYAGQGTGNIEIKVTMQIMKKEGLNIVDYFDIEDETVEYQYNIVKESPLLSEIPDSMHGRAII